MQDSQELFKAYNRLTGRFLYLDSVTRKYKEYGSVDLSDEDAAKAWLIKTRPTQEEHEFVTLKNPDAVISSFRFEIGYDWSTPDGECGFERIDCKEYDCRIEFICMEVV